MVKSALLIGKNENVERKNVKWEHLNRAIVAKPHTPMYLMHKYWARKPHNVVSEYIKTYTREGDIVLDPFSGSGVTAMESLKLGRKAVASDLNPISAFILKSTLSKVPKEKIDETFQIFEKKRSEIDELYSTQCPKCKGRALILATIWNRETKTPLELRCGCYKCKKKFSKKPDDEDLKKIERIQKIKIPFWYPKTRLAYNGKQFQEGTHLPEFESVDTVYTKRNLLALSVLFSEIKKIDDKKVRNLFEFAFTSMSHLASMMCPVAKPGPNSHWSALSATSFWPVHRYWIPPIFMESNVWMLFKSAVFGKQGIVAGLADAKEKVGAVSFANDFEDVANSANILIKTASALELTKFIPENSVDYIFTDPPYGGAVQYFELSTLWASWLGADLDYQNEITINTEQKKTFEYYHKMLSSAFKEMYKVLKPGKYLTVTFHSTDIAVWNSIIKAVVLAGFDLEKIIYQPPARPSAKGLLQPYGSAVGDYYIRFIKSSKASLELDIDMDIQSYERKVVMAAKGIIEERGEPTIYQHILNGIMVELEGGRYAPKGARKFEDILKDHIGNDFELIPILNAKGKETGHKWWLKGRDLSNLGTPPLMDRVETEVLRLLDDKVKVSFDKVLEAIFTRFPNALTPDTDGVKSILEDYALQTKDGNWQLRPSFDPSERKSRHTEMIFYLATLGKKAGFEIWVGQKEQGDSFNGKCLKDICDDIKVFRHVPQESFAIDRIKTIDLMWIENGRIKYEFEVENTTGISEAIIRGSNISDETGVKRFIVISKDREKKLHSKLEEPILKRAVEKSGWKFLWYTDIERLFSKKASFEKKDLEKLAKIPSKGSDQTQQKLLT